MRNTIVVTTLCLILSSLMLGQGGLPPDYTARHVSLQVLNPPNPTTFGQVTTSGTSGANTYYYWVITNTTLGSSSPAGPFPVFTANGTLSGSNFDVIAWSPVIGATNYDVLRTTTLTPPTGNCACAVATAQTSTSVNDQSNTLNAYTVSAQPDPSTLWLTLQNEPTAAGASHLVLRQGNPAGSPSKVADLSLASQFDGTNFKATEGVCAGAVAGSDVLCADATLHAFKSSLNNGSFVAIPQLAGDLGGTAASPTVTGGTHLATNVITTGNLYQAAEAAAPSAVASSDLLWADSTAHRWLVNANNGTTGTLVDTGNANTAAAGMTLDLSAATGANAFKVPVAAGATAGANGAVAYDSTNNNTHLRTNSADSIAAAEASAIAANAIPKATDSTHGLLTGSCLSDNGTNLSCSEVTNLGNTVVLTADSTGITATTPGTAIFTLGTMKASTNYGFHCVGTYSQATAAAANGVSIQGATNAPTRLDASYNAFTSNAGAAAEGSLANLTTTTFTALSGTFTPSATATVFNWAVDGVVQNGASATTLKIGFFTGNASDALTIKAGSYCSLLP
jgi:hypothetical protein